MMNSTPGLPTRASSSVFTKCSLSEAGRFLRSLMPQLCSAKLVNFCHVTSKTAWIFPAKELVKVCRKLNIPVMVDGAQAAGHLDVSARDVDADWYVGTAHKWCYTCPGVAFLITRALLLSHTNLI